MPCPTCGTDWRNQLVRRFEGGRYHYTSTCARGHAIVDVGGPSDETPARAARRDAQRAVVATIQAAHYRGRELWLKAAELVTGVYYDPGLAALDAHYAGRASPEELALVIENGLCAALTVPEDVAFDVLTTARWERIDRDAARAFVRGLLAERTVDEDDEDDEDGAAITPAPVAHPIEAQLFDELFAPDEVAFYSNTAWLDELRDRVVRDGVAALHVVIGDNAGMPVSIGHVLSWRSRAVVALDRDVLAVAFEP